LANDSGFAACILAVCPGGKRFAPQAKISESNLGKKKKNNQILFCQRLTTGALLPAGFLKRKMSANDAGLIETRG
jgi:hypothetical protein